MSILLKKGLLDVKKAAGILNTEYNINAEITNITTDSRETESGSLFIAIIGENMNGHNFIKQAVARGAVAVIASEIPEGLTGEEKQRLLLVPNTVYAFGALAGAYRDLISPKVIAVTGSVGKTTTKEFVYSVASSAFRSHKTNGNFNNEIGMPITVLNMPTDTQVCVLELGMSYENEISRMSKNVKPDIAVITNIGNSHIENLGSRENICKAKLEICDGMSDDGLLILNADEPMLFAVKGKLRQKTVYVSLQNPNAEYRALNIRENGTYTEFDILAKDRLLTNIRIPTVGRHNVYDAAIAFAVGEALNIGDAAIKNGLLSFSNTGMRQNIYSYGNYNFIEDCYNASPESMMASLGVLSDVSLKHKGKSVAVLGDMRELGDYSDRLHKEVGMYVASKHISKLITVGSFAEKIALGALDHAYPSEDILICKSCDAVDKIADKIFPLLQNGDTVLFKASRAVKLERVIEKLKALIDGAN